MNVLLDCIYTLTIAGLGLILLAYSAAIVVLKALLEKLERNLSRWRYTRLLRRAYQGGICLAGFDCQLMSGLQRHCPNRNACSDLLR